MIFEVLCIKHTWCLFVNARFFFCSLFVNSSFSFVNDPFSVVVSAPDKESPLPDAPFRVKRLSSLLFPSHGYHHCEAALHNTSKTPEGFTMKGGCNVLAPQKGLLSDTAGRSVSPSLPEHCSWLQKYSGRKDTPLSLAMWRMCTTTIQQIFPSTLAHAPSWQSTWTTEPKKNPSCIVNFHFVLTFHKGTLSTYCQEFC